VTALAGGPEAWSGLAARVRASGTAALADLHALWGDGVVLAGPAGHVVAPDGTARSATRIRFAGSWHERADVRVEDLRAPELTRHGLSAFLVRVPGAVPAVDERAVTAASWTCFGLSLRLLDLTLEHLAGRRVRDAPLLHQQLVKGTLGEISIGHLTVETLLTESPGAATCPVRVAEHLDGVDRALLGLLGAHGYVDGGPGDLGHLAALLRNTYLVASGAARSEGTAR